MIAVSGLVKRFGRFTALDRLDLPEWVYRFSVFDHAPRYPAEALSATPLVAMTAVAALLLGAGLVGLRRRDPR